MYIEYMHFIRFKIGMLHVFQFGSGMHIDSECKVCSPSHFLN